MIFYGKFVHLDTQGPCQENTTRVGVFVDKAIEMIISILETYQINDGHGPCPALNVKAR